MVEIGLTFDGVIGVLPGEGEALSQFDSVFLTQGAAQ